MNEESDVAVGIISANKCGEWIYDEINNGIDLGYLEHIKDCEDYKKRGECYCDVGDFGYILIGNWKRTWRYYVGDRQVERGTPGARKRLQYVPDKEGKDGFAAELIKDSNNIRVYWSRYIVTDVHWCFQGCYPNQANLEQVGGNVEAYHLCPELCVCMECETFGKEVKHYPEFDGLMLCVDCEKEKRDEQLGLVSQTEA